MHPTAHPYKTLDALIAALRKAPAGTVNYGSAGMGGPAHLTAVMLERAAGVNMLHIAYKGTGPAMPSGGV